MAVLTANDLPVVEGHIYMPRTGGAWHADLHVDGTGIAAEDAVTLSVAGGELTLRGTAARAGDYLDAGWVRVVGGAGGLGTTQAAKFYRSVQLRIPLTDLLATAGEMLSSTTDTAILSTSLQTWTLMEQPVSSALAALFAKATAGTAWRIIEDGTLWAGTETWPDAGLIYEEIARHPQQQVIEIGVDAPLLLPGRTLGGERVGYVEHHVYPDRVRTLAYLEAT